MVLALDYAKLMEQRLVTNKLVVEITQAQSLEIPKVRVMESRLDLY